MDRAKLVLVRLNERPGNHPFLSEANVTGVYPPLGISYIAGAARAAGIPTQIIDAHALNLNLVQVGEKIARANPVAVGITTTTFNWPNAVALARLIRRTMPKIKLIVGGPQMAVLPEVSMEASAFDLGIVAEGEPIIAEVIRRIEGGDDLSGIPGTVRHADGEIQYGPELPAVADLDSLPMPEIDLLPLYSYRALTLPTPFATMITSRGCPFKCTYCSQAYVGGRYREHSAERVLAEIERAVAHFGAKEVVFFDETFTVNRKRLVQICEGILASGRKFSWNVRTRGDLLDEEVLRLMKKAGCNSVHVGIESGDRDIQKAMNKNLDLDQLARTLGFAKRAGMETRGYFMIGFPGESLEQIERTVSLSLKLPLDWASYSITTPHPGTEIYLQAGRSGRFTEDYWEKYTRGEVSQPPGYFTCDQYDEQKLTQLLESAYRRFYLRLEIIFNKVRSRRLWLELPRIAAEIIHLKLG